MFLTIWLFFFVILVPVCMFGIKPQSHWYMRVGRVLAAWLLGYIGCTLAMWGALEWIKDSPYPYDAKNHDYVMEIDSNILMWAKLGGIFTFLYITLCETAWRLKHKNHMLHRKVHLGIGDEWITNAVFYTGLTTLFAILLIVCVGVVFSLS